MTLKEIEALPGDFIGSKEIAEVCGMNRADVLRKAYEKDPLQRWAFAYTLNGNRLMVPKEAFLKWARGEQDAPADTRDLRALAAVLCTALREAVQNNTVREASS